MEGTAFFRASCSELKRELATEILGLYQFFFLPQRTGSLRNEYQIQEHPMRKIGI